MNSEQLIPNAVGRLDDVVEAIRDHDLDRAADLLDSELARLEAKQEQIRNDLGKIEKAISEVNHFRRKFRSDEEWERVRVACGGGTGAVSEEKKTIPIRIAKPTATDLEMLKDLARAFNEIDNGYLPSDEAFEAIDRIRSRGNFDRCVWTLDTLLWSENAIVDPDADHVALHPRFEKMAAENERLAKRVAELEAEIAPIDPDGYQLGDFRVMKTAQEIARYGMDRNINHPVTVKTARRVIWAIKEFVEQARLWHGLTKLQPYRWTSLGRDDENFIDVEFDTTESPADYDPDSFKPLADMQPPFEGPIVGFEPTLDPARVLATAAELGWGPTVYAEMTLLRDAKPYRLKGADE